MDLALLMHGGWPVLALAALVALDGPFPMVPSEPLLMTASAILVGHGDAPALAALLAAAVVGSVAGDAAMFALGRTRRRAPAGSGLSRWAAEHVVARTGVVMVGARFLPAGRLVSTTAAGRFGVPLRRFLLWSLASSVAWSGWMVALGAALGPWVGGDPVRGLVAGTVTAVVLGGAVELGRRLTRWSTLDIERIDVNERCSR